MTTWVLLRGLTRGSGHWAGFGDVLRARLQTQHVHLLDLPGNGALHCVRSPIRIASMTECCIAQLQSLGAAPPYHLLAVSLGGMVAIDWAQRRPDSLAGVVLVNTSLRRFSPWHQRLRSGNWLRLSLAALAPGSPADREGAILRLTSRHAAAAAAVLAPWSALRETQPVSATNALRQLLAAARFDAPLRAPRVPMLVLSSERDALVDPRCSAAIAAHWGCASAVHPSAGHDLTLDDGRWVTERIARWLETSGDAT